MSFQIVEIDNPEDVGGGDISFPDAATGAFGRLRTSGVLTLYEATCVYGLNERQWSGKATGAGASISHNTNRASVDMVVGTASGEKTTRQSRRHIAYEPGKSALIFATAVMGAKKSNVEQRIGYFDDDNGLFFEQDGTDLKVVRRTKTSGSAVDNAVIQDNWNLDTMDGNGPSGVNIDTSKTQIFVIDFQWLGVGRVRMGFDIAGKVVYCHEFLHANVLDVVYMSNPNLPVRYEIENTGVAASATTLEQICAQVGAEGLTPPRVAPYAGDRGGRTVSLNTTFKPVISIRLKSGSLGRYVKLKDFYVVTTTNDNLIIRLIWNTSLTGASWVSAGADSAVEFDVSSTAISGGEALQASAFTNRIRGVSTGIDDELFLGYDLDSGDSDIITVIARTSSGSANGLGGMNWVELQ